MALSDEELAAIGSAMDYLNDSLKDVSSDVTHGTPARQHATSDNATGHFNANNTPRYQRPSGKLSRPSMRQGLDTANSHPHVPRLSNPTTFDVPPSPERKNMAVIQKRKAEPNATERPTKRQHTTTLATKNPSPKKGKKQSKTTYRRPEDVGFYWSKTEAEWAEMSNLDRGRFSHIGRIEETDDGNKPVLAIATSICPDEKRLMVSADLKPYSY
jgi:hypothetical protein